MQQFAIIRPKTQDVLSLRCRELRDTYVIAGLEPLKIDHGIVIRTPHGGIGIVVYEYSLFVPPAEQSYFAINGRLYGGNAVLYGFGETISLPALLPVVFLPNAAAVERNITLGLVQRPQMIANDEVLWQWPDPRKG